MSKGDSTHAQHGHQADAASTEAGSQGSSTAPARSGLTTINAAGPGLSHVDVRGTGPLDATLMVVGEAHGQNEEREGRPFCLVPETLVLMGDLSWKSLDDIAIGDEIITVEEFNFRPDEIKPHWGHSTRRRWTYATVLAKHRRYGPAVEVTTPHGSLVGSGDHRVLNAAYGSGWKGRGWLEIDRLVAGGQRGSKIRFTCSPWQTLTSYDAGWLAGFLDGEGCVTGSRGGAKHGIKVGFAQNRGITLDRAGRIVEELGLPFGAREESSSKGVVCVKRYSLDEFEGTLRLLGSVRPVRLLADFERVLRSKPVGLRGTASPVLSKIEVGERALVDITTTTGTFIANGFAVHNCGVSGDELNRYLSSIRISRSSVYVTNVVNARPANNSDPTREMIAAHSQRLGEELLLVRPRYVLALGRYALQWFKGPTASITREWGLPFTVQLCGEHGLPFEGEQRCQRCDEQDAGTWSVVLVSAHHPAYGLYMPDDQILIQEALEGRMGLTWGLRRVMDGELAPHPPRDEYPNPSYSEILEPADVERLLGSAQVVAIDTEGSPAHPWCISICVEPGVAYVIAAGNAGCIAALREWLAKHQPLVVFHFASHDLEVLAAMGIEIPTASLRDTMLVAHLLGPHFSQALKLGSYRELGMQMRDYTDLTRDADRELAVAYLERVIAEGKCEPCRGRGLVVVATRLKNGKLRRSPHKCEVCNGDGTSWPVPQAIPLWENGKLSLWQPSPVGKRVRRILEDVRAGKANRDGEPTDPRARWEDADPPEAIEPVVAALGPMPRATLDMVPRAEAVEYAARDADATLRRHLLLDPLIDTWGLRETYNTDLQIIPIIVEMQQAGMQVDKEYFANLSSEWRAEMARVRHQLQRLVGYYVNPASSKQVANLLFVKLRLPPVKLTKSKEGESTDDKVLEQLALTTKSPAIPLIQRHRELHKLDGTYAEPLSKIESRDGRVRMEFRYTRTPTGRLSSAKPRSGQNKRNYIQGQNIPTRTEEGKRIRKGIVAKKGCLIGSWDLSQIEWRVMAHLSQDANLLRVFREGHDLHRMTASLIWKILLAEVTAAQRSSAKNIGFGMGYKISWRGLQQQFAVRGIELSKDEAQAFIDGFMEAYPGIPRYWDRVFAEARRNGYVRHPDGRIRWATAIKCSASWIREAAERELGNSPVQGFAAYIMKLIMIATKTKVIAPLRRAGFDVKLLLVVHDSLEQEFPEGVEAMLDPLMRRVMRETVKLSVPVSGEGAWGVNWAACKGE